MKLYLAVFRGEISRVFADQRSHIVDSLAWIIYTSLLFSAVVVILGGITGGEYGEESQLAVLVGWLTFQVAGSCMMSLQEDVETEAETGTLEQVALSPAPLVFIFLARSVAYFLLRGALGLVTGILLLLLVVRVLPAGNGLALGTLFLISLLGAYGLGFGMAGLNLVIKRISAVAEVVFSLMIFLTGSLVGLEQIPILFEVTRITFPLTWGISLMRAVLEGADLNALARSGELLGLAAHSLVYLAAGLFIFSWGYRKARIKGTVGHY